MSLDRCSCLRSRAICALLLGALWCSRVIAAEATIRGDEPPDPALLDLLARTLAAEVQQPDHFDAQVWLIASDQKLVRYVADPAERVAILQNAYREANRHRIDADLILAVMHVESRFDRFAISKVGAQGLMQVMPFWRKEIGRPLDNLTEIDTNVRYGSAILAHYLAKSRGDLVDALARYNGSRGRLDYPELVVRAFRRTWQTRLTAEIPQLRAGCLAYGLRACESVR